MSTEISSNFLINHAMTRQHDRTNKFSHDIRLSQAVSNKDPNQYCIPAWGVNELCRKV